jgi:orotidine-5'-phosphate decarboxylase
MNPILQKYNDRADRADSLLCVGLDCDIRRLPQRFAASATPQFDFNRWIIDQTAEYAAAFKPNMAFYEARGASGLNDLQQTMEYLRNYCPDILTICDAKRADIGTTNEAYATSIFDELGFDAVTLHPYLGSEALKPFLDRRDKSCIILCRTSNPGAGELQDLQLAGKPLWQHVAEKVSNEWDTDGNCMLVVGATYPQEMAAVRSIAPDTTILVPGIGAQGGDLAATVSAGLDRYGRGLIISSSREIIFSANPGTAAATLRDAINLAKEAVHAATRG